MTTMTIHGGLRRLEFVPSQSDRQQARTHVVVEFARSDRLGPDQIVRINLGIRAGIERTLEGVPSLITAPERTKKTAEYVYRLEGDVG